MLAIKRKLNSPSIFLVSYLFMVPLMALLVFLFMSSSAWSFFELDPKSDQATYEGKGKLIDPAGNKTLAKYKLTLVAERLGPNEVKVTQDYKKEDGSTFSSVYITSQKNRYYILLLDGERNSIGEGYCYELSTEGSKKCHYKFHGHSKGQDQFFTVLGNRIYRMGQKTTEEGKMIIWREGLTRKSSIPSPLGPRS